MSHISKEKGRWPCEFAAMHDCVDSEGLSEYCSIYDDPEDCDKYHRKMIAEGEETKEEYTLWKTKQHMIKPVASE